MFQIRQFYYCCVCLQPAVKTFITKILFLSNCDLNPTGCRSFLFLLKKIRGKKDPVIEALKYILLKADERGERHN